MIDIVLDTEVFRRDPNRKSGPFHALGFLSAAGEIRLHIPHVARMEFLTNREAEIELHANGAVTAIRKLQRAAITKESVDALDVWMQQEAEIRSRELEAIRERFDLWCEENHASIIEIDPEHGAEAMRRYFAGAPPFKQPKSRNDLPDAFVLLAALKTAKSCDRVVLVTADKELRKSAKQEGMEAVESIDALLAIEELHDALADGALSAQVSALAESAWNQALADQFLEKEIAQQAVGRRVYAFYPIEGDYEIMRVHGVYDASLEHALRYYGDGFLEIGFSAVLDLELGLTIGQSRLETVSEKRREAAFAIVGSDDNASLVTLRRQEVVSCALIVAAESNPPQGDPTSVRFERALELRKIWWESNDAKMPNDVMTRHALVVAKREIAAGNLNVSRDEEEEKDRVERAKWFPLPDEMIGTFGNLTTKPGTKFKIAPHPRFEIWVKIVKESLLKKAETAESDIGEAPSE